MIAAGAVYPDGNPGYGLTVVRLGGADGALEWQRVSSQPSDARDLTVDGHGDVYLAGTGGTSASNALAVAKIAGATGDDAWITRQSDADGRWQTAQRVVVDGDAVFAAGMTNDGSGQAGDSDGWVFRVTRLDPATGAILWTYRDGGAYHPGFASGLAVAADGSVIAAGFTGTPATCTDAFVVSLDRATGALCSSDTIDGPLSTRYCNASCEAGICSDADLDGMDGLGVDGAGRVIVAGHLFGGTPRRPTITAFIVLSATDPFRRPRYQSRRPAWDSSASTSPRSTRSCAS